jgi:hypothetical protein
MKWEKMEDKIGGIKEVWETVKTDLETFIKNN